MTNLVVIRPQDDTSAEQASSWCNAFLTHKAMAQHSVTFDVHIHTPADTQNILRALGSEAKLVCYFGHGNETAWLTNDSPTVDANSVAPVSGKTILSIACLTAMRFGPAAITAGAESWLGFNIRVTYVLRGGLDPFGEAIVDALQLLSNSGTVQDVRDRLYHNFNQLAAKFVDPNHTLRQWPEAPLAHYAAIALRDHVVALGNTSVAPL